MSKHLVTTRSELFSSLKRNNNSVKEENTLRSL